MNKKIAVIGSPGGKVIFQENQENYQKHQCITWIIFSETRIKHIQERK